MSNQRNEQELAALAANMEAVCGPAARYSDYRQGESIQYRVGQEVRTGLILHVCPAQAFLSQHLPLTYLCLPENAGEGCWPDYVYSCDILLSETLD